MFKRIILLLILIFYTIITYSQNPNDCEFAIEICGNSMLNIDPDGFGNYEFDRPGNPQPSCYGFYNQTLWLRFTFTSSGIFTFDINPHNPEANYDFAIFQTSRGCSELGPSLRCSSTHPLAANVPANTGLNLTESDTEEGPIDHGNGYLKFLEVEEGEQYYVILDTADEDGGFILEYTGTASLSNEIFAYDADNLSLCDDDGTPDEQSQFNLGVLIPDIKGSQPNTIVTFHTSENDASIGINNLPNLYENTTNPETVFARVEGPSECADITSFDLIILDKVELMTPNDVVMCDADNSGSEDYDLNQIIPELTEDTMGLDFTFFSSQSDADNNENSINEMFSITNQMQTVFVRVDSDTLCYNTISFTLQLGSALLTKPEPLIFCTNNTSENYDLNTILPEVLDDTTGFVISYHTNQADANNDMNSISPNVVLTENITTYYIRVEDEEISNCYSTVSFEASISRNPTAETPVPFKNCVDDLNISYTFNLAEKDSEILGNLNSEDYQVKYYTSSIDRDNDINEVVIFENTELTHTIYARLINIHSNCFDDVQFDIEVYKNPIPKFEKEFYFVCLFNNQPIELAVQNNFSYYEWSTGEEGANLNSIQVNTAGEYSVTVTDENSCTTTISTQVNLSSIATITNVYVEDFQGGSNSVTITVTGEGIYEYALENGPYQSSNTFNDLENDYYTVFVKDINGCGIVDQEILVLDYPKFFTPNNDGFNDFWKITGIEDFPVTKIYVFDRYGKLIKHLSPISPGWNGVSNGEQMPSSDYWFYIELNDGRVIKGNFTLKR